MADAVTPLACSTLRLRSTTQTQAPSTPVAPSSSLRLLNYILRLLSFGSLILGYLLIFYCAGGSWSSLLLSSVFAISQFLVKSIFGAHIILLITHYWWTKEYTLIKFLRQFFSPWNSLPPAHLLSFLVSFTSLSSLSDSLEIQCSSWWNPPDALISFVPLCFLLALCSSLDWLLSRPGHSLCLTFLDPGTSALSAHSPVCMEHFL